jgi:hypothetical protein
MIRDMILDIEAMTAYDFIYHKGLEYICQNCVAPFLTEFYSKEGFENYMRALRDCPEKNILDEGYWLALSLCSDCGEFIDFYITNFEKYPHLTKLHNRLMNQFPMGIASGNNTHFLLCNHCTEKYELKILKNIRDEELPLHLDWFSNRAKNEFENRFKK